MLMMYPVTGRLAMTSSHYTLIEVFVETDLDFYSFGGLGGLSPKAINASSENSENPFVLFALTLYLYVFPRIASTPFNAE